MDLATILMATSLIGADISHYDFPTHASSYDGTERNISEFYQSQNNEITLTTLTLINDGHVQLTVDNGYKSNKLTITKSLAVQVNKSYKINDEWSYTVSGGTKFGGKSKHTSCKDSYAREYHCASLTAFSDLNQSHTIPYNVGLTFNYRF